MYTTKLFSFTLLFALLITLSLAIPYTSIKQGGTESPEENEAEASMEAEPSSSPEPEEVCVDVRYLSHVPSDQLVHKHHIMSDVLCPSDSSLPCATSNHMIRVNNQAMSYGQYCENNNVKCIKDKMEVNSVLSHLWKEESHDNGLVKLTMFDYRHPESTQKLLHRFISSRRSITNKLF